MAHFESEEFKKLFVEDINEHFDVIMGLISRLGDNDILYRIMREFHSVKGACSFMEFTHMAGLACVLETILYNALHSHLELNEELIKKITNAILNMRKSVERISKEEKENDLSNLIKQLKEDTGVKTDGVCRLPS